ncbi:Hint domain-containing protein [Roseovarius rhodophyticola]|uniref:Hint domain-containing protein n=1 Tax=Roseovarius rhodophyticola TaxID=3080827 RepID=A0ABZ2TIB5_9RHOB|nr:Hint domain-containing protein [Roseovarius sp. W115]MDV2928388.1 Hint domain-containing protein [Roseovarius sp. W115]
MPNNVNDPFAANLVGLWDFLSSDPDADTGLADGVAQDGEFEGDAFASGDALQTDGRGDYFDVNGGNDAAFNLSEGSVAVQFTQDAHVGTSDDTLVNRGEFNDRSSEGYFGINVSLEGAVNVRHVDGGEDVNVSTPDDFFSPGDTVKATYTWSETEGGRFFVENLTTGENYSQDIDTTGLTMDIGDNDDESWTFAAREKDDGRYDHFFNGSIDYVAVYNTDILGEPDGVVSGNDADNEIDADFLGDPQGDRVDNEDAILPGAAPNDDVIDALGGDDEVEAGEGNDVVFGGSGDDEVEGGAGDDIIFGDSSLSGPATEDGDDDLEGGAGDDQIFGEGGDDEIEGGDGNDLISGGDGEDELSGGADRDTFIDITAGDEIDGGETTTSGDPDDDFDTLDLTGAAEAENPGGSLRVTFTSADQEDGFVTFFDADGNETGEAEFSNIENVIPCFTPGMVIATPTGERLVEDLQVGDRVITRDNGLQEIRWIGQRDLTKQELRQAPHLKPVLIRAGSLGHGLPERDMLVSPQHRLLLASEKSSLYFEEREVLAAAKHLTHKAGVEVVEASSVSYVHFMFDRHEVVLSNGSWTESFQPGQQVLDGMGHAQRSEIFNLFPELQDHDGIEAYQAARKSLKHHEARLLVG